MADLASVQAIVTGLVQGVFFRAYVVDHACRLGLNGYVRNLPSGDVEVVAEGERAQVDKLVRYLEIGPPAARVEKVTTNWSDYKGKYTGFRVLY